MANTKAFSDLRRFMLSQPFDTSLSEYKESLYPGDTLGLDKEVGPFYHYVLDWQTRSYEHLSEGILEFLGYDRSFADKGIEALFQIFHPDDVDAFQKIVAKWMELLLGKSEEEFNRYSGNFNFRVRKSNNSYVNLLQQPVYMSFDRKGNIVYEAGILSDITRYRNDGNISLLIVDPDNVPVIEYYPKEDFAPRVKLARQQLQKLEILSNSTDKPLIRMAQKAILENFTEENFGVQELCSHLNISRSQFFRSIKSVTGLTPHKLIKLYRMQHAMTLLSTSELNISEVAYAAGFHSHSYFTHCFHQNFGCTPSEYRINVQ